MFKTVVHVKHLHHSKYVAVSSGSRGESPVSTAHDEDDSLDLGLFSAGSKPASSKRDPVNRVKVSEFFYSPTPVRSASNSADHSASSAEKAEVRPTSSSTSASSDVTEQLLYEYGLQEFGHHFSASHDDLF